MLPVAAVMETVSLAVVALRLVHDAGLPAGLMHGAFYLPAISLVFVRDNSSPRARAAVFLPAVGAPIGLLALRREQRTRAAATTPAAPLT